MKKHYQVGNFDFKVEKVKYLNEERYNLTVLFKSKEIDKINIGWNFDKDAIEMVADENEIILKVYKEYGHYQSYAPPLCAGDIDDTAYLITRYDVTTGRKTYGVQSEYRKDRNELQEGQKVFNDFKEKINQSSLEL